MNTSEFLSVPQLAERLHVRESKIRGWITRGELSAVDVSDRVGSGRPRWRIAEAELQQFLDRRQHRPAMKKTRAKRSRADGWITYI